MIFSFGGDIFLLNWIVSEVFLFLDVGFCFICGVIGCYGCVFLWFVEIKKEKKYKGVRKKLLGKLYFNIMF